MTRPFATVLDASTSLDNKTGSWRTMRPEYKSKLPPCNATCPAGSNIQHWLSLAKEGKIREAWEEIVKNNPFPAIMGRVCYHTCEKVCNRGQFDGAVNINSIEKAIGDTAIAKNWQFENTTAAVDGKVLVIGAGPGGLSAAYFLKMLGYNVTVYDNHRKPGGMMRYGIPRYRLPSDIIDAEIGRIENLGVKIISNKKIDNINDVLSEFDAVYVSIGAHLAEKTDVNIEKGACVISAIDMFQRLEEEPDTVPNLGDNVLVYGGGNTAIDAAGTALRRGAKNVKIIYRRTINNMPAHETEIKEALDAGIEILCLRTVSSIEKGKVFVDLMNYDEESGILSKTGETETLCADSIIFAVGQSVDGGMFREINEITISEKGIVKVDKSMMTEAKGIFAGGDIISGKRSVTHAIGHAKKAAFCIDAYLRGIEYTPNHRKETANSKKINTSYYKKNPAIGSKDLTAEEIVVESSRCFSCGNCFHCDNCYGYCPDNAVIKHPDGS
ncbi:MAG: FAD-dependent oxidoreductase, partial [Holosporaceae bacterium]|nr:FAD-dependent oxidoreductase [Holosporaceae bacterium]